MACFEGSINVVGGIDGWAEDETSCLRCDRHAAAYPKLAKVDFLEGTRSKKDQRERDDTLQRLEKVPSIDRYELPRATCAGEAFLGYYVQERYNVYNDREFSKFHGSTTMEAAGVNCNFRLPQNQIGEKEEDVFLERQEKPRELVLCYSAGTKVAQNHMTHVIRQETATEMFEVMSEMAMEETGLSKAKLRAIKGAKQMLKQVIAKVAAKRKKEIELEAAEKRRMETGEQSASEPESKPRASGLQVPAFMRRAGSSEQAVGKKRKKARSDSASAGEPEKKRKRLTPTQPKRHPHRKSASTKSELQGLAALGFSIHGSASSKPEGRSGASMRSHESTKTSSTGVTKATVEAASSIDESSVPTTDFFELQKTLDGDSTVQFQSAINKVLQTISTFDEVPRERFLSASGGKEFAHAVLLASGDSVSASSSGRIPSSLDFAKHRACGEFGENEVMT